MDDVGIKQSQTRQSPRFGWAVPWRVRDFDVSQIDNIARGVTAVHNQSRKPAYSLLIGVNHATL